jgi:hypothetical protein
MPRKPKEQDAPASDIVTGDLLATADAAPTLSVVVAAPSAPVVPAKSPAERAVLALNSTAREVELAELVKKSADIVEVKNGDARAQVHRMAMDLKNTRVAIEKQGKDARDDATRFSKAVIVEQDRLIAITADEEVRLFKLRDDFDAEQARIAAEAKALEDARKAAIRVKIDAIANLPTQLAGTDAATLFAKVHELANTELFAADYGDAHDEAVAALNKAGEALFTLYQAAKAREDAETERLRLQAEETARLAAQAEANRIEAERVAEQQRKLDEQAATMRAVMAQQERAANAVQWLQKAAVATGDSDKLHEALTVAESYLVSPEDGDSYGDMRAMVQMAKGAAITTLTQRLAAKQAEELEAAHAEALEMDLEFDAREMERGGFVDLVAIMPGLAPINWDEPLLPLPEAASVRDAAIDAGEVQEPSDMEIIELVAVTYDMPFSQALERVAVIAFAELRALKEVTA